MGKLIYSLTTSIDGFVADKDGNFDWAVPLPEILATINHNLRNTSTFLFGRKMYETMKVWDQIPIDSEDKGMNDFVKIWQGAKKIIYSKSLTEAATLNTTLETEFNIEKVRKIIADSGQDFGIGGPTLAAKAIEAGIVDEYHHFIAPLILGNGNHWLPKNVKVDLQLNKVERYKNGFVYLRYDKV